MGAYLQALANGQDPRGPIGAQPQVVLYQQNTDPLNCAQDCTIPAVGNGVPLRTALNQSCRIILGPFTNPSTSTTNVNLLVGGFINGASTLRDIEVLVGLGLIPGPTALYVYNISTSTTDIGALKLQALNDFTVAVPYIIKGFTVRTSGTEDVLNAQFGQSATSFHADAGQIFNACSADIPAPACPPCPNGSAPTVALFNGCAIFLGAQDAFLYPVVPGATVTLDLCVEAFADINQYEQCANPAGGATTVVRTV